MILIPLDLELILFNRPTQVLDDTFGGEDTGGGDEQAHGQSGAAGGEFT